MAEPIKRSRGRPPKTKANDPVAVIKRIEEEQTRFGAKCSDTLEKLYSVIHGTALSADPKISIKDKIMCSKYCIESAEKYAEAGRKENPSAEVETPAEEEYNAPLISLVAVK